MRLEISPIEAFNIEHITQLHNSTLLRQKFHPMSSVNTYAYLGILDSDILLRGGKNVSVKNLRYEDD
jgi:hypothetical protein